MKCALCGKKIPLNKAYTIHIEPPSQNKESFSPYNLKACEECIFYLLSYSFNVLLKLDEKMSDWEGIPCESIS